MTQCIPLPLPMMFLFPSMSSFLPSLRQNIKSHVAYAIFLFLFYLLTPFLHAQTILSLVCLLTFPLLLNTSFHISATIGTVVHPCNNAKCNIGLLPHHYRLTHWTSIAQLMHHESWWPWKTVGFPDNELSLTDGYNYPHFSQLCPDPQRVNPILNLDSPLFWHHRLC